MARNADQIVAEQLGQLYLQLAIAQSRAEQAEERSAELQAQLNALEAANATIKDSKDKVAAKS